MDVPKPFEVAVVGNKFQVNAYHPKGSPDVTRYEVTVRTWSPQNACKYVANRDDLVKLRDWINSAIIAEHSRITRGSDEQ